MVRQKLVLGFRGACGYSRPYRRCGHVERFAMVAILCMAFGGRRLVGRLQSIKRSALALGSLLRIINRNGGRIAATEYFARP